MATRTFVLKKGRGPGGVIPLGPDFVTVEPETPFTVEGAHGDRFAVSDDYDQVKVTPGKDGARDTWTVIAKPKAAAETADAEAKDAKKDGEPK